MNILPSYEEIVALHKKYAPSEVAFNLVFTHCQIIWELAEQLIEKSRLSVDVELVKVGCLLHDIGVYRLYLPDGEIDHKKYITHGTLGYNLLKKEGFSEEICRVASCHTGVGLSRQEIEEDGIPIPPADYYAKTLEEKLVMYADKFHSKTTPPQFLTPRSYENKLAQFGEVKLARFKKFQDELGQPDLMMLAEKYGFEIV